MAGTEGVANYYEISLVMRTVAKELVLEILNTAEKAAKAAAAAGGHRCPAEERCVDALQRLKGVEIPREVAVNTDLGMRLSRLKSHPSDRIKELSRDVIRTHMTQRCQGSSSSRSYSYRPPQSKPRYNSDDRKVADHYSSRTNHTREEREWSPIIQLKKLNNWIKSVLIQLYTKQGDAVLDLACGKGGDLMKWDKARAGYYVGVDIADGSIKHCRERYNERRRSFPARLICGDCFKVGLDRVLADDEPFDVCSCQFALHYSWSTEARARRALANVSALLRPGGVFIGTMPDADVITERLRKAQGLRFGNSVYWIEFSEEFSEEKLKSSPFGIKYQFNLKSAIDNCPEWLVPFPVFKALAEEYDLELVFAKNSSDFVHEYMKKPEFIQLMRMINKSDKTPSPEEWEVAYLYLTFALRKCGQLDQKRPNVRQGRGSMHLKPSDIMFIPS